MEKSFVDYLEARVRGEEARNRPLRLGGAAYVQVCSAQAEILAHSTIRSALRALLLELDRHRRELTERLRSDRSAHEEELRSLQERNTHSVSAVRRECEDELSQTRSSHEEAVQQQQFRLGELLNQIREKQSELNRLRRDTEAIRLKSNEQLRQQTMSTEERLTDIRKQYPEMIEREVQEVLSATEAFQKQGIKERNQYESVAQERLEQWKQDSLERRSALYQEKEELWQQEQEKAARAREIRLQEAQSHKEATLRSLESDLKQRIDASSAEISQLESELNKENRELIETLAERRRTVVSQATATHRSTLERLHATLREMEQDHQGKLSFAKNRSQEIVKLQTIMKSLPRLSKQEVQWRIDLACEIMDLKGNIRVYSRVRPVLPVEEESGKSANCVAFPVEGDVSVRRDAVSNPEHFEFDSVFTPMSTQEDVFYEVLPYIQKLLDGYNICIFAYGQTGSGKTYTMEGPESNPGVNIRSLYTLFEMARDREQNYKYDFTMSILEIYNEHVYDLLADRPVAYLPTDSSDEEVNEGMKQLRRLKIRTGKSGNPFVESLQTTKITSFEEARELLSQGHSRRFEASHSLNEHSSRSHLVVTIDIIGKNRKTKERHSGSLNMIDLAGSERVTKTEATGQRLEEAKCINKSLSALGNVINSLGEQKKGHVPYRDSKLTYLLSSALGGQSKVLMFVNVSPAQYNIPETISSLQFASRCRKTDVGIAVRNKLKTMCGKSTITGKSTISGRSSLAP